MKAARKRRRKLRFHERFRHLLAGLIYSLDCYLIDTLLLTLGGRYAAAHLAESFWHLLAHMPATGGACHGPLFLQTRPDLFTIPRLRTDQVLRHADRSRH